MKKEKEKCVGHCFKKCEILLHIKEMDHEEVTRLEIIYRCAFCGKFKVKKII